MKKIIKQNEYWTVGKFQSVVVSSRKVQNNNFPSSPNSTESKDDEMDYYGGYLVCESIGNKDFAKLISAAPDLLEISKKLFKHALVLINSNHPDYKEFERVLNKIGDTVEVIK